jgi:DNA-binding response OmpR family regulator
MFSVSRYPPRRLSMREPVNSCARHGVALVVHPNDRVVNGLADCLREAGHAVSAATTFEEARRLLARNRADIVVANARLGAFHGLHLVFLARSANPGVIAFVLNHEEDRVLDREIRAAGALLCVGVDAEALVADVGRRLRDLELA